MHTPTKAQWQVVIDNFYKILPLTFEQGLGHLDMNESNVNSVEHECGTVHCVAGWYAVATLDLENNKVDFRDGANQMASDLGFSDESFPRTCKRSLEKFADCNPDIWGNAYGDSMFCSNEAYNGAESITDIINFLEGVRDRSPE